MADPLAPLARALREVIAWLDGHKVRGAIIGGVAASLRGRPRVTRDIDCLVLVDTEDWGALLEAAVSFGLLPRVQDPLVFARQSRVLLLRHQPTEVDIDVTFGALLFEDELVARATRVEVAGVSVRVATAQDLIVMKAVAGRPRDWADIEGILDADPDLDLDPVREQVQEFANLLDQPEIASRLEALIRSRE